MSNYSVKTRIRTAVPRGKRLREGAASESGSTGGSNPTGPSVGDGHTHTNKSDLDRIRVDGTYVKVYVDVEQEGETLKELESAYAGYADKAGMADEADHAIEADNAAKWGGNESEDYIDQPVKSDSDVEFNKVTAPEIVSPDFESGPLGSGYRLKEGNDGSSELEIDSISVRKSLQVTELIIQQLKHQGGIVFYTAASMEISKVETVSGGYKCYFDSKDGQIANEFSVGDQARCQRFALGKTVYKYYWRLVTAVGEDYVILSFSDCDSNSGTPEKGDILVQLGNRSDAKRQAAKVTTAIGDDAPRDDYYQGISSYDLTGKLVTTVGAKDGHVGIWTDDGSFTGAVSIRPGSGGLENLSEWSGFVSGLNGELQNLQDQIDGAIETWYYSGVPSLSNEPASEWTTPEDRNRHLGDLYYNKADGKAYRFMLDDSQYKWILVQDTDITSALAAAAAAQDTADHKRRVFVSRPTSGDTYDVGDLWVNATIEQYSNAILRCVVPKESGKAFSISHWTKADGYTDDSSLAEFIGSTYNPFVEDIQSQVDGKAQTWNQGTDPSISWETPEKKAKHVGDLWCNTANGNVTKVYTSSYTWASMDCVPQEIKEAIEQKASVYTAYPSDTPAEGDLLIPASDFTHSGVSYYAGQLYRYNGTSFEEIEYASNSDLAITVVEKEVWRKALREINSSKSSTVSILKAETTNVATVEGNEWVKIADHGDSNFGWYVSNCHVDGAKTVVTISIKCYDSCNMSVHLMSRGETSCDYAVLGPLNGVLKWTSEVRENITFYTPTNAVETTKGKQETDCAHTFSLSPGTHSFQIAYRKDYSTSKQPDNGYFKIDNVLSDGTLAEWCALCDRNGDTERKAAAISAANALFGYMNGTLHVWENVTTYMVNDSFRDTLRSLFAAYYVAINKIETEVLGRDLDFLKAVFSKATTTITGGVVDTAAVVSKVAVVTDEGNKVVAGLNGTGLVGNDETHKKLMLFAGANGLSGAGNSKFRVYEDGHVHASDAEIDGEIVARSGKIGGFDIEGSWLQALSDKYGFKISPATLKLYAETFNMSGGTLNSNFELHPYSSAYAGFMIFMRIVCEFMLTGSSSLPNILQYLKATGANPATYGTDGLPINGGNFAAWCEGGMYAGLRPHLRHVNSSVTLANTDHTIICYNTSAITLTLPANPEIGQTFEIWHITNNALNISSAGSGRYIYRITSSSSWNTSHSSSSLERMKLVYAHNIYHTSKTENGCWLLTYDGKTA